MKKKKRVFKVEDRKVSGVTRDNGEDSIRLGTKGCRGTMVGLINRTKVLDQLASFFSFFDFHYEHIVG